MAPSFGPYLPLLPHSSLSFLSPVPRPLLLFCLPPPPSPPSPPPHLLPPLNLTFLVRKSPRPLSLTGQRKRPRGCPASASCLQLSTGMHCRASGDGRSEAPVAWPWRAVGMANGPSAHCRPVVHTILQEHELRAVLELAVEHGLADEDIVMAVHRKLAAGEFTVGVCALFARWRPPPAPRAAPPIAACRATR